MPKKQKRPRHVHVDDYATLASAHQAEVARNQEHWKSERIDLSLPEKRAKGDHRAQRVRSHPDTPPTTGE